MSKPKQQPNCLPATQDNQKPIATNNRDSREDIFISLLFKGFGIREAGIAAGYSISYSETTIGAKFNDLKFQDKIREYALANNAQSIPKVCDLYNRTINVLHNEVSNGKLDNLAKLKHIPRQVLEIARILQPEGSQGPTMVNIQNLQMLVNGKFNGKPDSTDGSEE